MENGGIRLLAGVSVLAGVMFIFGPPTGASQDNTGQQQGAPKATATPSDAPETDASREELANFDRFLDSHPILERELGSNPSLVNDPNYVQREPDLQIFLSHHPNVKLELEKDPQYLARHRDLAENNAANRAKLDSSSNVEQAQAEQMNGFLRAHSEIEQLLQQNPALINDSTFLGAHADLQRFVSQHPRARDEFVRNPREFIAPGDQPSEPATARREPPPPRPARAKEVAREEPAFDFSVRAEDIARMDQFLEDHSKIAKDLSHDPLRVTDHHYLDHHKDLRQFFDEHSRLREAFAENPRYFVPSNGLGAAPPSLQTPENQRLTNRDLAETETFLRKHKGVARQIEGNPLLVQDLSYVQHHGDLRQFFDEHPHIQTEFEEHPRYFMQREDNFRQSESLEVQNHKR